MLGFFLLSFDEASSIKFKSGLLLGQSNKKHPRLLGAAVLYIRRVRRDSFVLEMAGDAAGGCLGVALHECRDPRQNSTKHSCLPYGVYLGREYFVLLSL